MSPRERTASERASMSRRKGAFWERAVARALKAYWPGETGARRSRDNGSKATADMGDIAGTGPAFYWSVKNDEKATTSPTGLITAWLEEATTKGPDQIPLLVTKRKGYQDPLDAWLYMWAHDFTALWIAAEIRRHAGMDAATFPPILQDPRFYVRLEFRHFLDLAQRGGYTTVPPPPPSAAEPARAEGEEVS